MKVIKVLKKVAVYVIIGAIATAQFVPWMVIGYSMGKSDTLEMEVLKRAR